MDRQPQQLPTAVLWSIVVIKLLLIAAIVGVLAFAFANWNAAEVEHARKMTAEEYAAGFEKYREETLEGDGPIWAMAAIMAVMLSTIFVVYETLGFGIGWLVSRLFVRRPPAFPEPAPLASPYSADRQQESR